MFAIYDTESFQYYARSGKWVARPKIWREASAIKGCLHTILKSHIRYTEGINDALYGLYKLSKEDRLLATIALIPERYHIMEWKDVGIIDLGSAKEWYGKTLQSQRLSGLSYSK